MDPRGIAQALFLFFGSVTLFLYLIAVCLVALASTRPWRRSNVRLALWAFPAAAAAPTACLAWLFESHAYSQMDTALTWGLAFLVVAGLALVANAFTASRRDRSMLKRPWAQKREPFPPRNPIGDAGSRNCTRR